MKVGQITIIQTGGTIDKDYPRKIKGYSFEIGEPAVLRILSKIDLCLNYHLISAFTKDSMDIDLSDREKLLKICQQDQNKHILITHGTDTMLETARFLNSIKDKTIVLTGSFKPEKFKDSDAEFNLGLALGAVQLLGKGVYIAMNGLIIPIDKADRDFTSGKFLYT